MSDKLGRKDIGPEAFGAFAEADLEGYRVPGVVLLSEEVGCVFEGGAAALDAVVHPVCAVKIVVDGDGGGLAARYGGALEDGDAVFSWVIGEGCSAGLSMEVLELHRCLGVNDRHTIPAAPPPMITTCLRLSLLLLSFEAPFVCWACPFSMLWRRWYSSLRRIDAESYEKNVSI